MTESRGKRRLRAIVVDDEPPARRRLVRMLGEHREIEIVGEAGDGLEALELAARERPDLVFLDIQMPELDGLATAASLQGGPSVVFVTAFDEHALRAFELAAVDYLLKPVKKERLATTLARLEAGPRGASASEQARAVARSLPAEKMRMALKVGTRFVVFDIERIVAVLAQDHYAAVLVDGKELLSDDALDVFEQRLPPSFLRVHRSAIVNLEAVRELEHEGDRRYVAVLSDEKRTRVAISRERLPEVRRRLGLG